MIGSDILMNFLLLEPHYGWVFWDYFFIFLMLFLWQLVSMIKYGEEGKKIMKELFEIISDEEIQEITWDALGMTWVTLKSWKELKADWIFIAVWTIPNTKIVDSLEVNKDEEWCLVVDKRQETSISGLYAAWDVTTNSNKFKQTIMSAAEWCLAADSIHEDLM